MEGSALQPHIEEELPETVIAASTGRIWPNLSELWQFRELFFSFLFRDIKLRYKQTVLGAAWSILQPLATMTVFSIFLGRLARIPTDNIPYPIFVYCGLLPWQMFASGMSAAAQSVVGAEGLITKVLFPRLYLPMAAVGSSLVDFTISFGVLVGMMAVYGYAPGWSILFVPVFALVIAGAAIGIGTLFAALNVSYRDFRYVIPFMVQLGLFATPTIYMDLNAAAALAGADPNEVVYAYLNPMTSIVESFRALVLGRPLPWLPLAGSVAFVLVTIAVGAWYFRRVEDDFVDKI